MAKLNYTKPLFDIRPIPLNGGAVAGGCALNPTSGDYICPVEDEYGEMVFTSKRDGCQVQNQSGEATICYLVMDSDFTVYNS